MNQPNQRLIHANTDAVRPKSRPGFLALSLPLLLLLLVVVAVMGSPVDGDGWGGVGLKASKLWPLDRAPRSDSRLIPLSLFADPLTWLAAHRDTGAVAGRPPHSLLLISRCVWWCRGQGLHTPPVVHLRVKEKKGLAPFFSFSFLFFWLKLISNGYL